MTSSINAATSRPPQPRQTCHPDRRGPGRPRDLRPRHPPHARRSLRPGAPVLLRSRHAGRPRIRGRRAARRECELAQPRRHHPTPALSRQGRSGRQADQGTPRPLRADPRRPRTRPGTPHRQRRSPTTRSFVDDRRRTHHRDRARHDPLGRPRQRARATRPLPAWSLRHTGATWMADAGIPLRILGHQSIETTKGYRHSDTSPQQSNRPTSSSPHRHREGSHRTAACLVCDASTSPLRPLHSGWNTALPADWSTSKALIGPLQRLTASRPPLSAWESIRPEPTPSSPDGHRQPSPDTTKPWRETCSHQGFAVGMTGFEPATP